MNFERSKIEHNNRTILVVLFDNCNELKILLKDWLGNNKTTSENVGLLMFKLGIVTDSNDIVRLYNFNSRNCSFCCVVNDKDIYEIRIKKLKRLDMNTEIEILSFNVKKVYECIPVRDIELGMRVIQKEHSVYQNKVYYTRYLSRNEALFAIRKKSYVLELGVAKPNDVMVPLFGSDGCYFKYEVDNELKLVKYLRELDFTESIVDIYKKICEISLGDVSRYPRMFIKLYIDNFKSQRIIGIINLVNGQLERFGMSINGTDRIVFIDKDNNWTYEVYNDLEYVKMYYDANEGKTNCNLSVNNIRMVNTLVGNNMENAWKDITDVKVRVRKLFDKTKLKDWEDIDSD